MPDRDIKQRFGTRLWDMWFRLPFRRMVPRRFTGNHACTVNVEAGSVNFRGHLYDVDAQTIEVLTTAWVWGPLQWHARITVRRTGGAVHAR